MLSWVLFCITRYFLDNAVFVSVFMYPADLVDVELGDRAVEQKIEIVQHRYDLHRRAFAGQSRERDNIREVDGRLRKQLGIHVNAGLQFLGHAPVRTQ